MANDVFYIHANPNGMKAIAEFLASQEEIGGCETTELECDGKRYPCFQIDSTQVSFIRQFVRDKPDVITAPRLFVRPEGPGKNARDVTFMLRTARVIRSTVLENVARRGRNGASSTRTKLVRVAK